MSLGRPRGTRSRQTDFPDRMAPRQKLQILRREFRIATLNCALPPLLVAHDTDIENTVAIVGRTREDMKRSGER
jgi:hypothetical protein